MQSNQNAPAFMNFLHQARELLGQLDAVNEATIQQAAAATATRLIRHGRFLGFGCGHSGLVSQDAYYRAGGLRGYRHLFAPPVELNQDPVAQSSVEEKRAGWIGEHLGSESIASEDVLVVISTSGVNAVPVEAALHAKERGALVIAITSCRASSKLPPRHDSGLRLMEVADHVLDNLSPWGDTLVAVGSAEEKMGSASTAAGSLLLQALCIAVREAALERGVALPVYVSGNVPGGMEQNRRETEE